MKRPNFTKLTYSKRGRRHFLDATADGWQCVWGSHDGILLPDHWIKFLRLRSDGSVVRRAKTLRIMTASEILDERHLLDPEQKETPAYHALNSTKCDGVWIDPKGRLIAEVTYEID